MIKFVKFFVNRFKNNKIIQISFYIYSVFCIFSFVWFILAKMFLNIVFSVAFLLVAIVPFIVEYIVKVKETSAYYISFLFFCALSLIGPAFDLYSKIKYLDTLIHMYSGILFAALGFTLGTKFINSPNKEKRNFYGCLLFSFLFCLSCGVIWEIVEYFSTLLFKVDNQEDTLIKSFVSYGLSGTRDYVTVINDVTETIIIYDGGKSITVKGGYLDLGLIDTIFDLTACYVGSSIFSLASVISFLNKKIFIKGYIPVSTGVGAPEEA